MKSIFRYSLFLCALSLKAIGLFSQAEAPAYNQRPTEIPAADIQEFNTSTYNELSDSWQARVEANKYDASAWLNYYKAERFSAQKSATHDISKEDKKKLDAIITSMSSAIPSTFEFHYAAYLHGDKSDESFNHLTTAHKLNPNNVELYDDMLCYALINGLAGEARLFAEKLTTAGVYNAAEVEYNRNVFGSIESNAILITNGNVDTYPLIMMQQLQQYRNDVLVVCLDWLNSSKYRSQVAGKIGISANGLSFEKLVNAKRERPLYVALTVPPASIKKFSNELYCTGLALKHSFVPLRNLETLAYNWEFQFVTTKIDGSDPLNKNYLVPLIQLRGHFQQQGKTQELVKIDQQIRDISERFGLSGAIKKHID